MLAALCEKTDNDIRACINTLQVGMGQLAVVGWSREQLPLTSHTPCPVPAWAGPARAECSGCADHTSWRQGSAQGALLCVARGLPVASSPEVSGVGRMSGQVSLGLDVCGALVLVTRPCVCRLDPALPIKTQGCIGPAFRAVPRPPPMTPPPRPRGHLRLGGHC